MTTVGDRWPVAMLLVLGISLPASAADPTGTDPEELLSPLRPGDEVTPGWRLIEAVRTEDLILVKLSGQEPATELTVRLTRRDERQAAFCRSRSFNVVYLKPVSERAQTPEDIQRLMDALCRLLDGNDRGQIELPPRHPPTEERRFSPTLILLWNMLLLFFGLGVVLWSLQRVPPLRRLAAAVDKFADRRVWWLMLLMLFALAWFRLAHLDLPFEADYMTQRFFFGSLDLGDILAHRYSDQRHPQLFYLILHFFLFLGSAEWIARLPAVLFSFASAAVLLALARPYLGGGRGLLVAGLLLISVAYLQHSRDVSDLTLFCTLALAACLLFLRCLQEANPRLWILFVVAETALFYSYYLAILVVFPQLLVALIFARTRRLRGLWLAAGAIIILAFPALWDLGRLILSDMGIRQAARQFPGHLWGETTTEQLWANFAALLLPQHPFGKVMPFLALAGVVRWGWSSYRRPEFILFTTLLFSSLLIIGLAVMLVRLQPYYLLFLLPFYLLFLVTGCIGLPAGESERSANGKISTAAGWALLVLVLFTYGQDLARRVPQLMSSQGRDQYARLGEYVKSAGEPRTMVADPDMMHTILLYYCFPEPQRAYRLCRHDDRPVYCLTESHAYYSLTAMGTMQRGWELRAWKRLQEIESKHESFWFVYTDRFQNPPLLEYITQRCRLREQWPPLRLYLCRAGE